MYLLRRNILVDLNQNMRTCFHVSKQPHRTSACRYVIAEGIDISIDENMVEPLT